MAGRGTDIQLGGNLDEQKNKDKKYLEKINFDKKRVMENGGLYIIGTERHESRRIDNQLRGRSGRQGEILDPLNFYFNQKMMTANFWI